MAIYTGTTGDDTITLSATYDTINLLAGNDTININASVDINGILTWSNAFNTVINSTDGGVIAPNYDKIVVNFSQEYIWGRKVGNDFQLSIYSTVQNVEADPLGVGEVGRITLQNAFTLSIGDRISRLEGPLGSAGFYFEAIATPVADAYGHTAIYKMHNPDTGDASVAYFESYKDVNNNETQQVRMLTNGNAVVRYYDADSNQTWLYQEITYSNYGTGSQAQISLTTYNDTNLIGTSGNDTLYGGSGNDSLTGGAGYDQLRGGAGDDTLDGGADYDSAEYWDATAAVNVNLVLNTATGGAGSDTLISIENVFGSSYNDTIIGNSDWNWLNGQNGNDTLTGNAGSDTFAIWNNSNDYSNDTVTDFQAGAGGDKVGLATNRFTNYSGGGNPFASGHVRLTQSGFDTLVEIDLDGSAGPGGYQTALTLTNVTKTNLVADNFTDSNNGALTFSPNITVGTSGNDTFAGTGGDDAYDGLAGNDSITGAAGNDTLYGSAGKDTLTGGSGNDYINGGVVTDRVNYSDLNVVVYAGEASAVTVNLSGIWGDGSNGTGYAFGTSAGSDTLANVNFVVASGNDDTITGSSALIFEQIDGRAGNDVLDGGAITDTLNQYNGNRVSYDATTTAGVVVDLIAGTAVGEAGSNAGSDTLFNFNEVRGSDFADTMLGSNRSDVTELFEGRGGNDSIDGRGGFDILRYSTATGPVTVNLITGTATGAGIGTDTFTNIEGVFGSANNDSLTGGNTANGTSIYDGLVEVFRGEAGNDTIDGGVGADRVDYTSSTTGVVVTLNDTLDGSASDGLGGTDVLRNIEGVRGSAFNDTLTGSDTALGESFEGREGNDVIDGKGGTDRVDYRQSTGSINVNLATGVATDGYGGTDSLLNIENVRGSRDFSDTITGSAANNSLEGWGGDERFYGSAGSDTLDGGSGFDRADYRNLGVAVTINMTAGTAVKAGGGTDTLISIERVMGSELADSITGSTANDDFSGNLGNDTLDGGAGFDNVWYGNAASAVAINLDTGVVSGGEGADTLISIENIEGSNFADTLIGSNADNYMRGDGDIYGPAATGSTADSMVGGAGFDVVDYRDESVGVTINLATQRATDGHGSQDTIEGFEEARGSDLNDSITGSTNLYFERFEGRGGNDTIDGGAITDTLNQDNSNQISYRNATSAVVVNLTNGTASGGAGNDVLSNMNEVRGSAYNDSIIGSNRTDVTELFEGREGNDTIDGAGGYDVLRFDNATNAVVADLAGGYAMGGNYGTDTFTNIEGLFGSAYDDVLTGGLAANGVLVSDGLQENFRGGAGNDTIDGGQGYDRADYTNSNSAVTVTLNDTLDGSALDGFGGTDVLRNIEGVRGSIYNDTLTGSNTAIFESFEGREGNDSIDGQGGVDRVDYKNSRAAVTVNLTANTASDGYGGTDTLLNIENVRGSRDFNDSITGSSAANRLEGLGGNDTLSGDAGNDTLEGGDGNDSLMGGTGADTLIGGAGDDYLDGGVVLDHLNGTDNNYVTYGDATGGMTINLSGITGNGSTGSGTATGGTRGTDTLVNINLLQGSGYNDTITGSAALIFEQIEGGAGDDSLNGGAITDTLNQDNANRVAYHNASAAVTVDLLAGTATGGAGTDTLANFNQVRGSGYNDTLLGSNRTDVTELFEGRGGDDSIDGRGGFDIVRYDNATAGVTANLATGTATGAGVGTDTLANIEGVFGSAFDDVLTGGNSANGVVTSDGLSEFFRGGAGNDTIDGGQGYDTADYTSSTSAVTVVLNDTLDGSANDGLGGTDVLRNIEAVRGSTFADTLTGSNSAAFESFEGREGNDSINGQGGIDRVDYRNARAGVTVNLTTGTASDGYGGTDTLLNIENVRGSRDFADIITGSAADNRLEGLGGNDTLDGGTGIDTAVYSGAKSAYTITKTLTGYTVSGGTDGVDTLTNIEKLAFSDATLTLKLPENDFDGDGKSDILWRNSVTGADQIWKSGNSATQQATGTVTDLNWKIMGTGDFDADGKSDILWRNSATGANTIWKAGNIATLQAVTTQADQAWKIAGTGDFDGDGKSDILWRNAVTGADQIWKSGNSATQQATGTVTDLNWKIMGTGDFDADGKSDILWRNTSTGANTIWKAGNIATLQAVTTQADQAWKIAGTGDFDGDGKSDILWRNAVTGADQIWKSGNSATQQATGTVTDLNWKVVGTGDFDADGKSDILWRNSATGADTIWKAGNIATLQAVTTQADQNWKIAPYTETVTVAKAAMDFDGDGKTDILWRNTATGTGSIWKSGNIATLQSVATLADQNWKIAGTGDFDADGKADILWRNTATGAGSIWKSGNIATLQSVATLADQNWKIMGTGDFDADGKADILWRNTATGANSIWKSGNIATLQSVATLADQNWKIMGTGDFDGDGKADILWRNTSTGAGSIWKSGNMATLQAVSTLADQNWKIMGTGDFDGDGKSDILWRNTSTGANSIWKSGNMATLQAVATLADQNWKITGTGDFDGDGKADILWRNTSTGAGSIWKSGNMATLQSVSTLADQNWSMTDGLETGDLLNGGAGNNTLFGSINNDFIYGAAGNDTMTGGLGVDTFRYLNSTEGSDSITDFLAGVDKLQVTGAGFAGLAAGALNGANFVTGTTATSGSAQFLYDSASGQLSFDADGTGGGGAVNLVTLVGLPALTAADIVVV